MISEVRGYEGTGYEDRPFAEKWTCKLFSYPRTSVPTYLRMTPRYSLTSAKLHKIGEREKKNVFFLVSD